MSRTLRRPMFRRGGKVNDGIMTGLEDREKLQAGTRDPAAAVSYTHLTLPTSNGV